MKVSGDPKLLHHLCEEYARTWGIDPGLIYWMRTVSDCIAGDPAGDTAQTAEPLEEEWFTAWRSIPYGEISLPRWPHLLCRTVSIEAHRLAALRVKGEKA